MSINLQEGCEICDILPAIPKPFIIDEDDFWVANLGFQDQSLLGRTYIALKRHAPELDDLTEQEETSLRIMRNGIIRAIREQFAPLTFNISCLKNDAFRHDPDTTPSSAAHVHWHIIPRYSTSAVSFAGETFEDPNPGRYLPSGRERKVVNDDVAIKIADAIRRRYLRDS
jgi:diadenosine tetraphosphate (Ap4A) HIT family hydrolase